MQKPPIIIILNVTMNTEVAIVNVTSYSGQCQGVIIYGIVLPIVYIH